MRTLRFLLQKEFSQIFRNRPLVVMMTFLPIVQLLILPLAANFEVKNISLAIVDLDHSSYSRKMISKITSSGYFRLVGYNKSFKEAFQLVEEDKADLVLEIPLAFEKNLVRENHQKVFMAVNAINGVKANLGGAYLMSILRDFNSEIRLEWFSAQEPAAPVIEVVSSNWFNPFMNYNIYMVPGILAVLVTMVSGYLSALNIVKEKEIGTIEQINVTPIKKYHFILGKLIPFWILGMVVFSVGLTVSWLIYGIAPVGSIPLLYCFLSLYMLAILGFGLLISTYSDTQQQAMFVAFFFMMIFILMGGLFTSIDSMPDWAKTVTLLNPLRYFIEVSRMILLKGSDFGDIKFHLLVVLVFAVVLNSWAVFNYRKTS